MIQLQRGEILPLRQRAGSTLHAGESFRLGRQGLALVEAFSDARISIEP